MKYLIIVLLLTSCLDGSSQHIVIRNSVTPDSVVMIGGYSGKKEPKYFVSFNSKIVATKCSECESWKVLDSAGFKYAIFRWRKSKGIEL